MPTLASQLHEPQFMLQLISLLAWAERCLADQRPQGVQVQGCLHDREARICNCCLLIHRLGRDLHLRTNFMFRKTLNLPRLT